METNITASPIVFTSRTGGSATAVAISSSRPATRPSSSAGISSPRRVNSTRSAKQTVRLAVPPIAPEARSAVAITSRRICSSMFACRAWTMVGPTSGIIASAAAAKRKAMSRSLSPG